MKKLWSVMVCLSSTTEPGRIFGLWLLLLLFHVHHLVSVSAQKQSNDDVIKLMAFKRFSVSSDPYGALSNWTDNNSPSLCSWRDVSCFFDGRVTALNLSYSGLSGSLHLPNLTSLSSLRQLYLQGNKFTAAYLSATSCNLETIELSSNAISNHLPTQSFVTACNNLAYVNLSRNSITGGSLMFGPSLLQLDISRNQISDSALLKYSLATCQNLKLLNISDNKLTGKAP